MTLEEIYVNLQGIGKNLVFISETDSTVSAIRGKRPVEELNATTFKQSMRFANLAPVETDTLEHFFNPQISHDENWIILRDYMQKNIENLQVFRIRRFINKNEIDIYVVGTFEQMPVGITVFAVET